MSEVIGSVQVVVRPDTTGFAKDARKGIEKQFKRKNALELDFEVDPDQVRRDVEDSRDLAQKWLDLKKNALKVHTTLAWSKRDLLGQLRDFKTDVEALEKLQRPTVYANFEVDRRGLDAIRENIKLNVELDSKTLQRSIKKATEDITVFGDPKALKKKTESAAKLSSRVFQDILSKQRLRLEIDADTEEIEKAQKAMEDALGRYSRSKNHLEGLEGSLAGVTKEMNRQANLVKRLTLEWEELESSGELNARQLSAYANSLRDAEDSLAEMVRHERRIRNERDRYSNNIFSPSLDGAKRLQREFEQLERQLDDKQVEIKAVAERSSFLAVAAELNVMARDRMVLFWARVQKVGLGQVSRQFQMISKASGDAANNVAKWLGQLMGVRVLWRTFRDMVDWLPRLDMMVPQLAQNLALITSATAGAVGGVGILFTLLSDIGEVGKLIVGLPAILTGVAGSALIVGRAIVDFKDTFPEIISYYEKLGETVSSKVWDQAAASVRKLHAATKPILNANVPTWATAWGDSMASLGEGLGSDNGLGNLEIFLKNSIKGTKNAEKGWKSLGSAIMSMVGGGSAVFPELGEWFSETMADFDSWAQGNQGNLGRWLREGATALSELGSIGVSTVKIIAGIADAFEAAGWPGLTEAASAMRSLGEGALELKDSGSFMQTLDQVRGFFVAMEQLGPRASVAISNAWTMIGHAAETLAAPISGAIGGILDGFNSPKFQDGFGKFLTGLGSFIRDVTPGLEAMTAEIGSLLGVVGTAGKSWGPAFNDMLMLFSDAGDNLHPGLIDFVENTGPALQELVQDLAPHVEDFAQSLSDLLGNENFQEFLTDMVATFGTIAGWALDLGGWIADLASKFSDWYSSLGEGGQAVVRWGIIIGGAFGGLALAIGGFVLKLAGWLGKFRQIGTLLKNTKLGGLIGKAIGGIGKLLKGIGDDIALRGLYLWDKIKGVGTRIGGALKGLFGKIKLPSLGKLTGGIGKMFAPLINVFKGLPGKLLRLLPKAGSIFKGLAPRILKIIGGPLGWLLLLRDAVNLIKPVGVLEFVEMILDKLGLGDSWVSDVIGGFKENIEKAFGKDVGLFDLINPLSNMITKAWDGMVEGFDEGGLWGAIKGFFSGLGEGFLDHFQFAWENLKSVIGSFAPQGVIDFFDDPWGTIKGWIFGKDGDITAAMAPAQDHLAADMDFSKGLEGTIPEALQGAWDKVIGFFMKWSPAGIAFRIGSWLGEKIKGWLGIEGGIDLPDLGELAAWGTDFWNDKVLPKLQGGWDAFIGFIKDWSPIGIAFRLGTWIGGKIRDWLGIGEDGGLDLSGFSIDFDFSSLWEEKIKPALTAGLLALAGLILAPGLILIAPLALPALIIGWLLGRDGEGDWSFQELTDKISGAWESFKGALSTGLEALKGFVSGAIFAPIDIGAKIVEWVLGSDWIETAKTAITTAFTGGAPTLGATIGEGVRSIVTSAETGGGHNLGTGFMRRLLGLGSGEIPLVSSGFQAIAESVGGFTGGVEGDYGGMARSTRGDLSDMDRDTRSKFADMEKNASSKAAAMHAKVLAETGTMQTGVVGKMSTMQSLATARTMAMSKSVAGHAAQANRLSVAQAAMMQGQYVKQVATMQTSALRYSGLIASRMPGVLRINLTPSASYSGSSFSSGLSSSLSRSQGIARSMAGRIRSALRVNAFSSGSSIGSTFASGLRSRISSVSTAASALASAARRNLPNSPADEGPFSGKGWGGWGESIADELARGMRLGAPAVAAEASRMMDSVASKLNASGQIGVSPDARSIRAALSSDGLAEAPATGSVINVNVESSAEDPLQDGTRLGRDITFALRGAGLA